MEPFLILLLACVLVLFTCGSIAGCVALFSLGGQRRMMKRLEQRVETLGERLGALETRHAVQTAQEPKTAADADAELHLTREEMKWDQGPVGPFPESTPPSPVSLKREQQPRSPARPSPSAGREWWTSFEETVGKRWMTWAGALALFLSAVFFVKYAFDNEWLGPTGRVVFGIVIGLALMIAGDVCTRRLMRALGIGLMGSALAVLYVSLFAAFSLYHLIPQAIAFALLVTVTACGAALAILHNAMALSFIAVLGGLLTPVMLSTGANARDVLFAYLVVLDLGGLALAFFKGWRSLDLLAFLGTWALFLGWFIEFYRASAMVPTLCWLGVFYVVFLVVPFAYQYRTGRSAEPERFAMAVGDAAIAFAFAYRILHEDYQYALGFVALFMAAIYLGMAVANRHHIPRDHRALLGFVTLSVAFLTLAVPLHLKLHGVTLMWAVEGPVLLYLGFVYQYRPVRVGAMLVLAPAVVWLFTHHWPLHDSPHWFMINTSFASAMAVPSAAAAYAVIQFRENERRTLVDDYLMRVGGMTAGLLALLVLSAEAASRLDYLPGDYGMQSEYFAGSAIAVIWAIGSLGFVFVALRIRSTVAFYGGLSAAAVAVAFALLGYTIRHPVDYLIFLNVRFCAGVVVAGTLAACAIVAGSGQGGVSSLRPYIKQSLWVNVGVFPLALLSLEAYTYCLETIANLRTAGWAGQMSLSIVWSLYAVVTLILGFRLRTRTVRLAALALLALTAVKLVLIDMAHVEQLYRIVSFVVLGAIMFAASYLYHRLELWLESVGGQQ